MQAFQVAGVPGNGDLTQYEGGFLVAEVQREHGQESVVVDVDHALPVASAWEVREPSVGAGGWWVGRSVMAATPRAVPQERLTAAWLPESTFLQRLKPS